MNSDSGSPITFNKTISVTVEGGDNGEDGAVNIANTITQRMELMIEEKLIEQGRYGGQLNPRGGM